MRPGSTAALRWISGLALCAATGAQATSSCQTGYACFHAGMPLYGRGDGLDGPAAAAMALAAAVHERRSETRLDGWTQACFSPPAPPACDGGGPIPGAPRIDGAALDPATFPPMTAADRRRVANLARRASGARSGLADAAADFSTASARTLPAAASGHLPTLDGASAAARLSRGEVLVVAHGRFRAGVRQTAAGRQVRLEKRQAGRAEAIDGFFRSTHPDGSPRYWVLIHDPWLASLEWHELNRLTDQPRLVTLPNPRRAEGSRQPANITERQTLDLGPGRGGPPSEVAPGGERYLGYFTSGEYELAGPAGPLGDLDFQGDDDAEANQIARGWGFTQGMTIEVVDGVDWLLVP